MEAGAPGRGHDRLHVSPPSDSAGGRSGVPPPARVGDAAERKKLRDVIRNGRLTVAWQPIVDLASGSVVGHEALCRGPKGTSFEAAEHMFASSHSLRLAHELDEACHVAVLGSDADLGPGGRL